MKMPMPKLLQGLLAALLASFSYGCLTPEQIALEREWAKKDYDPHWGHPNDPPTTFGRMGGISVPASAIRVK